MRSILQVVGYHRTAGYGGIAKTRLRKGGLLAFVQFDSLFCVPFLFFGVAQGGSVVLLVRRKLKNKLSQCVEKGIGSHFLAHFLR